MAASSISLFLSFSLQSVLRLEVSLHNILHNSLPPQAVYHTSHNATFPSQRPVKLNAAGSLLAVGIQRRKSGGLWELVEIYVSSSVQRVFVVQCLPGDCACVRARVCLWCLQQCQCPPLTQATTSLLPTLRDTLGSNYCAVSVCNGEVNKGGKRKLNSVEKRRTKKDIGTRNSHPLKPGGVFALEDRQGYLANSL